MIAENVNQAFPDRLYLIICPAAQPTTYKAVQVWRTRHEDQETPGEVDKSPAR